MPKPLDLPGLLQQAVSRRQPILADPKTDCCRLVHGSADEVPGLQLDLLGTVLIAQLLEEHLQAGEDAVRAACEQIMADLGATAVYRKTYPRHRSGANTALDAAHSDPRPWIGQPVEAPLTVTEHGLTFLVHPFDGYATGLFLDARANRKRVRQRADGRRVLNLFAYTCGYSVAALAGGCGQIVNVDAARRALLRGRENFAANGLDPDGHKWVAEDVPTYLGRIARRGEQFDLVILDPPSFGRVKGRKRPFRLQDDLPQMLEQVVTCCGPGAIILLSTNHRGSTRRDLQQAAERAGAGRIRVTERPKLPLDFHGDPDYAKSIWLSAD